MSEYEGTSWRASREHYTSTAWQPDGDVNLFALVDNFYNFSWVMSPISWNDDTEIYGVTGQKIFVARFNGVYGLGGDHEYFVPNFMTKRHNELIESIYDVHVDEHLLKSSEPDYLYIKVHAVGLKKDPSWVEFYDPNTRKRERHDYGSLLAWHESLSFKIDVASEQLNETLYSNRYAGNRDRQNYLKGKIYAMGVMYAREDVTLDQIVNVLLAVGGNFPLAYETLRTLIDTDSLDVAVSHIKEVYGQKKDSDIFF